MDLQILIREIEKEYLNDPTTQPTAFWKFAKWASHSDMNIINHLGMSSFILNNSMICRYPYHYGYNSDLDENLSELVFSHKQNLEPKWKETKYFKLYHDHGNINSETNNSETKNSEIELNMERFEYRCVTNTEFSEVVQFINENYEKIRVNESQVKSWTEHAVYDSNLWIWIIDKESMEKAALGIAEVDIERREGALEWIQVDSKFRGRGLGKVLVHELLKRIAVSAKFTTVSGEVDNDTNPEQLYRACGFQGDSIWYVYKRI